MSFRFVKISSLYNGAVQWFEKDHAKRFSSYEEAHRTLCSKNLFWSNYYEKHLRRLGIDAYEIFTNVPSVQQKWADENGVESRSEEEIVLRQLIALKPEVVFLQASSAFSNNWVSRMKEALPSLRLLIGWRCSPFTGEDLKNFRLHDAIFTCNPVLKEEFERSGIVSHVLNHAFEPSVYDVVKTMSESPWAQRLKKSVVFAGSLIQAKEFHLGRRRFLIDLLESNIPLQIFSESSPITKRILKRFAGEFESVLEKFGVSEFLPAKSMRRRMSLWQDIVVFDPIEQRLLKHSAPAAFGNDFYRILREALLCLNFHIDSSGKCAGNARLFEATGMGTCLVTDWKANIADFFDPDSEIVTFKDADDCKEKIKWLLQNPDKAREIGQRGQARCLKDHSFEKRAYELHQWVQSKLSRLPRSGIIASGHSLARSSEVLIPQSTATDMQPIA